MENYSGRYFRTSWGDIKGSRGWFGKICLLGIISWIPVFGQMTVYGYAYEWAHKAAWGVNGPMPKKIYGRDGSKMLRWGWFALVIAFVFMLVPGIVSSIGSVMTSAGTAESFISSAGRYFTVGRSNPLLVGGGWLFGVAAIVLYVFAALFIWAGTMRMAMYDRLSTGFQLGKVWAMIKRDFGGIMRIFGMALIFGLIGGAIIAAVICFIVFVAAMMIVAPAGLVYQNGMMYYQETLALYALGALAVLFPVFLVIGYISTVYGVFIELLTARALGYWMRQFNVGAWGTMDDPLPVPGEPIRVNYQQAPNVVSAQNPASAGAAAPEVVSVDVEMAGGASASAAQAPAPPTGEPVIEADVPIVAEVVVETAVTDVEGERDQ